jgi:hypothetical protein
MFSSQTSQKILYASVGLSIYSIYKHASICLYEIFPVLDTALGIHNPVTFSAKSNYLQVSVLLATFGIFPTFISRQKSERLRYISNFATQVGERGSQR